MTLSEAIRIILDRMPEEILREDGLLDDAVHVVRVEFDL